MNRTVLKVFLLVLYVCGAYGQSLKSEKYSPHHYENDTISEVNVLLYTTANKYFCQYKQIINPELIIYGTKSWSLPKQDVNLTLSYPPKNNANHFGDLKKPYIITGFSVIILADSNEPQGFISSGGILQESISLTFVCSDVSLLVYEFWLYGIPSDTPSFVEATAAGLQPQPNDMCAPKDLNHKI